MSNQPNQMFNLDNVSVRHDPFTVLYLREVLDDQSYRELADTFPPLSQFRFRTKLGNKYLLNEFEGDVYHDFINSSPPWRRFYDEIKGREFKTQMLALLRAHKIDLTTGHGDAANDLTARFEFSVLPARGGSQRPHTDSPAKAVTLVLSLMKDDEWDPAWGGGTSICRPKDPTQYFNYSNRYLEFDEVEIVDAFPFAANAGVLFVKTSVSWHCVTPINVPGEPALRKTVAISLYRGDDAKPTIDGAPGNATVSW